jgi:hypothetical protein
MFWMRDGRAKRRKKVLDELLDLDPVERRARMDAAVASGDVRESEVESALLLVRRLDVLRVMTVPSSGRLPGGVMPVTDHKLGVRAAAAAASTQAIGIVVESDDSTGGDGPGGAWDRVALTGHSGAHSSRRRRTRASRPGRLPVASGRARAV